MMPVILAAFFSAIGQFSTKLLPRDRAIRNTLLFFVTGKLGLAVVTGITHTRVTQSRRVGGRVHPKSMVAFYLLSPPIRICTEPEFE